MYKLSSMKNVLIIAVFLFSSTLSIGNGMLINNGMLANANVKILGLYPCEETTIYNPQVVVRPGDSFDITADIPAQVDETYTVVIQIDKLVGKQWQKNFINVRGKLCEILNKYAKKLWEKVRLSATPPVEGECIIPKGKYLIRNQSISPDELSIPSTFYGIYKAYFKVYNTDGELFLCNIMEVDSQKNI